MSEELCHCGEPLHYGSKGVESQMKEIVNKMGRFITIENYETHKKYKVDRHYIALHGIESIELDNLGFEEIK